MKLLLIEPNIDGRVSTPPINISILKSYINERTKHKASIADLTFQKDNWRDYLIQRLSEDKYDLVGISTLTFNYSQSLDIAKFIKNNYGITIIFGGVHVILMPQEVIQHEAVDIVCTGEGEYTLHELMDNHLDCTGIKGLWFKEHNEVIKNDPREMIENLDLLPFPDFSDFDMEKYFLLNSNLLPIMVSRGCPYNCTYCSNHALKKTLKGKQYVRFRSVNNVMQEIQLRIKQYYDTGTKIFLQFQDDTFILNSKWVSDFCASYTHHKFHEKVLFWVTVRPNLVTDRTIRLIKESGCYGVAMGVESSDDSILNEVFKRNMTIQTIENAINIIKNHNLVLLIPIIIGAPYETVEVMEKNFEFAKKVQADITLLYILTPLPSTEIKTICEKENLIEKSQLKDSMAILTEPVVRTKYVEKEQIISHVKRFRRYLIRKHFFEGIRMKGFLFFLDLFIFLFYIKPKYHLEIDNAWKFTINKYNLARIRKERNLIE